VVTVRNLKSRPYITLTLQMMQEFGYKDTTPDYESFQILPANRSRQTIHYSMEGDWSGAAFLLVAAVLHGNVSVDGLDRFSMHSDKAILVALEDAGAGIDYQPGKINIEETALTAFEFDATDCPDLF